MTRESREPTTNETVQKQLESAYHTAREKLESAYEEGRRWLDSALGSLREEVDARRERSAGSRDAAGTSVTVERGPPAGSERDVEEPSAPGSADEPPATSPVADDGPSTPPPGEPEPTAGGSVVDDAVEAEAPGGGDEPVESLSGIGPAYAERLGEAGVETVGDLAAADPAAVAEATGLGEGRIASWIEQAQGG